jgi:hypothetical protein
MDERTISEVPAGYSKPLKVGQNTLTGGKSMKIWIVAEFPLLLPLASSKNL